MVFMLLRIWIMVILSWKCVTELRLLMSELSFSTPIRYCKKILKTCDRSVKFLTEVEYYRQKWPFFLALSEVSFSVKICDRSVLCRLWDICSYPSFLKEFDNAFKLVVLYFLEMKINFLYSLFMSLITTSRAFSVC